jgi:predicted flavoprotein YhiN
MLLLDLRPGLTLGELTKRLQSPRGSRSVSNHLRKFGGLTPPAVGLLNETTGAQKLRSTDPPELAKMIKTCCLSLTATSGLDRAISTAGGISRDAVDERFMLRKKAGVFAAGEMLDWQVPTGGYLLQGSFSTAVAAARGMLAWIGEQTLDEAI